jgi:translation initiation factor 6
MVAVKNVVKGSSYIGAFATATDKYAFCGYDLTAHDKKQLGETLNAEPIDVSIGNSDLIGIFMRGNSKGLLLSNLATDSEMDYIKKACGKLNIAILESPLNAIGNNVMANDSIALVNPDYDKNAVQTIGKTLGVKVVKTEIGKFKTVGANNILTNKGIVVNNYCTDKEKELIDEETGFDSVRSTANTGALGIGLSVVANSYGIMAGGETTGFELARILEGLNIGD